MVANRDRILVHEFAFEPGDELVESVDVKIYADFSVAPAESGDVKWSLTWKAVDESEDGEATTDA